MTTFQSTLPVVAQEAALNENTTAEPGTINEENSGSDDSESSEDEQNGED
jgi:hypothetical protein